MESKKQTSKPTKQTNRGGRPPSNVAKRVREEGKTGFPYGLVGDMVVKYSSDDIDELKENESLDFVNLLTFLGKDIPKRKKFCSHNCSFKHTATPVLFMDDPGELASDEEAHSESYSAVNTGGRDVLTSDREQVGEELQQVTTSLITPAPLWSKRAPQVMNYIPKCSEEDYSWKVKHELGFDFPPVMGKCMEHLVREIWTNVEDQRCGEALDSTLDSHYHSLVVDARVKLTRLIQAYIRRRSEPGASERCALADEKVVAREVLGRHHSDIDDTTSSESEEEFKDGFSDTPSSSECKLKPLQPTLSTSSESSDAEQSVRNSNSGSSSQQSDSENCYKTSPKQSTCRRSDTNVITSEHKAITKQKRRSESFAGPGSKAQRSSCDDQLNTVPVVSKRHLRSRRRSVPVQEVETCSASSDSPETEESDWSSWSEDS